MDALSPQACRMQPKVCPTSIDAVECHVEGQLMKEAHTPSA